MIKELIWKITGARAAINEREKEARDLRNELRHVESMQANFAVGFDVPVESRSMSGLEDFCPKTYVLRKGIAVRRVEEALAPTSVLEQRAAVSSLANEVADKTYDAFMEAAGFRTTKGEE